MRIDKVLNQSGLYEDGVKIEITPETLVQYNNERFWTKVAIKAQTNLCWEWLANRPNKYGQFSINRRSIPASRAAYILTYGEIPEKLMVCHECDNPICCNPGHLFLGTGSDNQQDMIAKGRSNRANGEKSHYAKLSLEDVIEIKKLKKQGVSAVEISKKYPVNIRQIFRVVSGERWSYLQK